MIEPVKEIKLGEWAIKSEKGIVGFLAFVNYLREFSDPRVLTSCGETFRAYVRNGGKPFSEFENDREAQERSRELREGLSRHKLKSYGGTGNLIVMTDASDDVVGGVAFEPPAGCHGEVDELRQVLNGRQIIGVHSRPFNAAETRWGVFEKEIYAIIQACERYPVLLDPGVRVVFRADRKNKGKYMTTMLANGRVGGDVHRWMASFGEGLARGIKAPRYIRGEENWIADGLSPLRFRDKGEPAVDPTVKSCLDLFFNDQRRVNYRRGKLRDNTSEEEGEEEDAQGRISLMSTCLEGRGRLIEEGRRFAAKDDRSNLPKEDAECMAKRTLRNEGRTRRLRKPSGKKQGATRKGGEDDEKGAERKRQRKDGTVSPEGHPTKAVEASKDLGEKSASSHTTESPEDSRTAEGSTESGSSSSNLHRGEQQAAGSREKETRKQVTAAGGSLTMTHRVDARGESFRIPSKEAKDPRGRREARYSCEEHGRGITGRTAWDYFQKALAGRKGKEVEEKNDFDYLSCLLGGKSWKAGKVGGEICASPANLERDRREQIDGPPLWERAQGQPNIAGIEWTPVRRFQDELQ